MGVPIKYSAVKVSKKKAAASLIYLRLLLSRFKQHFSLMVDFEKTGVNIP